MKNDNTRVLGKELKEKIYIADLGKVKTLKWSAKGVNINIKTSDGATSFQYIAGNGKIESLEWSVKANDEAMNLHYTAGDKKIDMLELSVKGVNINATTDHGVTYFHCITGDGKVEKLEWLQEVDPLRPIATWEVKYLDIDNQHDAQYDNGEITAIGKDEIAET